MLRVSMGNILIILIYLLSFTVAANVETKDSDYTIKQNEEYLAKIKTDLKNIKMDLDDLEKSVKRASGHVYHKEANDKIKTAKERVSKLDAIVAKFKNSSEKGWGKIKTKYNESLSSAKDAIADSRRWLSEKIEPDQKRENK